MHHLIGVATQEREHGVGLVALRNTNHWMRAATYGYQACEAGMAALCFTNTQPNMPAWGATDARLGAAALGGRARTGGGARDGRAGEASPRRCARTQASGTQP